MGVLKAADNAQQQGAGEMCAIEFGVAGGSGLIALEQCAEMVTRELGIKIQVCGFDAGSGLPELCGDYRDHPDQWMPLDYAMDEAALRRRLRPTTNLILGNVADTVPQFVAEQQSAPVGFVSFDMDLYSSTAAALQIFSRTDRNMLRRTILYFDDVDFDCSHKFAGELLAIQEFNERNEQVKIDRWRSCRKQCVFKDNPWIDKMYVAHDLEAISNVQLGRQPDQETCSLKI
ncbi:MAG: hypothetical protein KDA42_06620 [Planctomycetales bacterium]|nr:hypothetical protein [Planctomycetales bacterium]